MNKWDNYHEVMVNGFVPMNRQIFCPQ